MGREREEGKKCTGAGIDKAKKKGWGKVKTGQGVSESDLTPCEYLMKCMEILIHTTIYNVRVYRIAGNFRMVQIFAYFA